MSRGTERAGWQTLLSSQYCPCNSRGRNIIGKGWPYPTFFLIVITIRISIACPVVEIGSRTEIAGWQTLLSSLSSSHYSPCNSHGRNIIGIGWPYPTLFPNSYINQNKCSLCMNLQSNQGSRGTERAGRQTLLSSLSSSHNCPCNSRGRNIIGKGWPYPTLFPNGYYNQNKNSLSGSWNGQ